MFPYSNKIALEKLETKAKFHKKLNAGGRIYAINALMLMKLYKN